MKIYKLIICAALCISCVCPVHADSVSGKPYNWYCCHVKDGTQPKCDAELSVIEKYNGYYIDKLNCDPSAVEKVIYFTFDAGYENGNIAKILDVLKEEEVPAAFFVLEHLVVKNADLIQRMHADGHLVCNHTAKHPDMTKKHSSEEFLAELKRLEEVCIASAGVEISKFYRPPEGRFSEENLKFASDAGYKTVFWSFGYVDWDNERQMSPDDALDKIINGLHNGEVLLLHPTSNTNAAIMKHLITELKTRGYRFGTLDELCASDSNIG